MRRRGIVKRVFPVKETVLPISRKNWGTVLLFIFLLPYIMSMLLSGHEAKESAVSIGDDSIMLIVKQTTGTLEMTMDEYIKGMLPTVISADYEPETLKAQAILLRTNLLEQYKTGVTQAGENKLLIEESEEHYINREQWRSIWGKDFETYMGNIIQAVEETSGLYLTYEKKIAKAPYFQVSAGSTRSMADTVGKESYPYLRQKECPKDFLSDTYIHKIKISKKQFQDKIRKETENQNLSSLLPELKADSEGYVNTLQWKTKDEEGKEQDYTITGEIFRTWFELPSACFQIEEGEQIYITVKGVGHGFGMSQFAANEMAKEGSDYMEILTYFFTNIAIDKFE